MQAAGKPPKTPVKKSILKKHKFKIGFFSKACTLAGLAKEVSPKASAAGAGTGAPASVAAPDVPPSAGVAAPANDTVKLGDKVCVISDRSRAVCGRDGTVKQILGGIVTVATGSLQVLQAPLEDVRLTSSFGDKLTPKKLTMLANKDRVQWLMQCGFDDHRGEDDTFVRLHNLLKGAAPFLLGVDHLKIFTCWLGWAFPLETLTRPVVFLQGDLLKAWYGALIDAKETPEHLAALQREWTRQGFLMKNQGFLTKIKGFLMKVIGFLMKIKGFLMKIKGFLMKIRGFLLKI